MSDVNSQKSEVRIFCPLSSVLCLLSIFAGLAYGQEGMRVGSIEVVGNRAVRRDSILAEAQIRVDDVFNEQTAREGRDRIAKLEGIAWVTYDTKVEQGRIKLTFIIGEKNIVREIAFIGNRAYKAGKLQGKLGFARGDFLDPFLARSGRDALVEFYQGRGFAFVQVSLDESAEDGLGVGRVVYTIEEGPRAKITAVRLVGNEKVTSFALKRAIKTKTRQWLVLPAYYNEEKAENDVVRLLDIYQKKGHLEARVDKQLEFTPDKGQVYITFVISEGPIYTVEELVLQGNVHFDDEVILGEMRQRRGERYSEGQANYDVKKILAFYRREGFIDGRVVHRRSYTGRPSGVRSEFDIVEGERFRIGQVKIMGNIETQEKVIRRVLDEYGFKPGEWYNADIASGAGVGKLENAVRNMAMMESATISPVGTFAGQRDAQVSVTEGQTGMVMLGAGVDSSMGLVGQLVFEQRNFDIRDWPESWGEFFTGKAFKGAGQRLRVSLEPGTELSQYYVSFTEPYLQDKPISLDVSGLRYVRLRESYDEERTRGFVGFEKRYSEGWRKGVGFRVENVDVADIESDAPRQIRTDSGNNLLGGIKLYLTRDMTDSRFNPTEGYLFTAGYEQVAGDHTFGVLDGTYRRFKTIHEDLAGRKTVLATKLRAAGIVGDAPAFEKFYAGGIGSIRGFDYRGISTRGTPSDDPIGSDWIFLANAEVAVPLTSEAISWLFFVDSGTIDSGGYRAAVGTGIQILIPQWFGAVPMSLGIATPVMKDGDDDTQAFFFTIGRFF